MSKQGYLNVQSHGQQLIQWAKTLQAMQSGGRHGIPTLRVEVEVDGERNDTYTVHMVVMLERDVAKIADFVDAPHGEAENE